MMIVKGNRRPVAARDSFLHNPYWYQQVEFVKTGFQGSAFDVDRQNGWFFIARWHKRCLAFGVQDTSPVRDSLARPIPVKTTLEVV